MNTPPKVSIIIPIYNCDKYLAECLDSVVGQTLRNIEIICIDDGSTDSSPKILDEYAKKDSRIIVIHQKNAGPGAARNVGIDLAKGEYILFVDSDDKVFPNLCEKAVVTADREQSDMTFYFYESNYLSNFSKSDNIIEKIIHNNPIFKADEIINRDDLYLFYITSPWSKLWRSSFLRDKGIVFPNNSGAEDAIVHWKALVRNPRLSIVPETLYWYRMHFQSLTLHSNRGYGKDCVHVYKTIKDDLVSLGKFKGELQRFLLSSRLSHIYLRYTILKQNFRTMIEQDIRDLFGKEEYDFLNQKNNLPWYIRTFYYAIIYKTFVSKIENFIGIIFTKIFRSIKFKYNQLYNILRNFV
jgi:glycosyltransferase involved in cell wall biosynthesis